MALFDRVRALLGPSIAESGEGEHDVTPSPSAEYSERGRGSARDIDPNNLTSGSGSRYGPYLQSASALVNAFTGQGTSRDPSSFNLWSTPRTLNRVERHGMGRNALVKQALGKIPDTATREGWDVRILDDSVEDKQAVTDQIRTYEQRLAITNRINRALFRGRQHGQALVILGIEDGRSFADPVDVDNIRTIHWAAVIDARDFNPYKLAPSTSEHFGSVEIFEVTNINGVLEDGLRYGADSVSYDYDTWSGVLESEATNGGGQLYVHMDRVLYFPTGDYYSLLDSLQDSLGAYFETMGGIRTAAREASMLKYKVNNNKRQQWSANAELAKNHMRLVQLAKSAFNAFVLGDDEDVSVLTRPLAGIADLANPIMAWVAASLSIPNTIFWQVSPGGFGKGESERETFHEDVHAFQEQILTPQLTRLHAYILAAFDGAQLSPTTKREIHYNDLSPPDEEMTSKLRNEALAELRLEAKDGLITRKEFRAVAEKLHDPYYQLTLEDEFTEIAPPAQVGIFTGSLALLTSIYGEGNIPLGAARALMLALDPVHFNSGNISQIVPDIDTAPTMPSTGGSGGPDEPDGSTVPPLADDEDAAHEPTEVDLVWEDIDWPADADTAKNLAALPELDRDGVRSFHIKRLAREGHLRALKPKGYSREPGFSLQEVKRALLERHGHLAAETSATDVRDYGAQSLCVMFKLPPKLARCVPYNEVHPGPPHVTLVYCKHVEADDVAEIVSSLELTLASIGSPELRVSGDEPDYFDTPKGRCAYAPVTFGDRQDDYFEAAADAFAAHGYEIERFDSGYTPHVTLAYLAEGETGYEGLAPEGSWLAEKALVTLGGEEIAEIEFSTKA